MHNLQPSWIVLFHHGFETEFTGLSEPLQDRLLEHAAVLSRFGPGLGRPLVDTLNGSRHANMKELRFSWDRATWRVAFAFDPLRRAILLVGGDKGGTAQRRFYRRLIALADERYDGHLAAITKTTTGG
jgi:hypothetical protein